ncbi:MAG: hypothetical protein K6A23_04340, partial [Butyrivibrio sp.]|nr:hypothetical protein [Butyrivibrio sp.]
GVCTWWGEGEPIFASATKRENVDRLPGKIHNIYLDHINMTSEAPIILAGEEYSPIEDISVTEDTYMEKMFFK